MLEIPHVKRLSWCFGHHTWLHPFRGISPMDNILETFRGRPIIRNKYPVVPTLSGLPSVQYSRMLFFVARAHSQRV